MIPRLRMRRVLPYPAGTGTSSPRMQGQAGADYFSNAAAYHRSQVDRVKDVPDSLWFVYEFYGEPGTR